MEKCKPKSVECAKKLFQLKAFTELNIKIQLKFKLLTYYLGGL